MFDQDSCILMEVQLKCAYQVLKQVGSVAPGQISESNFYTAIIYVSPQKQ